MTLDKFYDSTGVIAESGNVNDGNVLSGNILTVVDISSLECKNGNI
jgi:hypothetical protein